MAEQLVEVRDGALFWRGVYHRTEDMQRLLALFEADHEPHARDLAAQLRAALIKAGAIQMERAA